MISRTSALFAAFAVTVMLAACSDASNPVSVAMSETPRFSGSGIDATLNAGGGGTTTGGGSTTPASCGTLSTNVQTYNIVVYTTRIGIGFSGTATNCGTRKEAFQVDVTDTSTDPYCAVNVPHFIAARNTDPGMVQSWNANSTLVNCLNTTHTFDVTLRDTKTNTVLATTTVSAFL